MDRDKFEKKLNDAFSGRKVWPRQFIRRKSAVLIPVVYIENEPHILFEIRSKKLRHQPGEICFPGGGLEGNESPSRTAVRETCEELLVSRDQVELIGPCHILSRLYDAYIRSYAGIIRGYEGTFDTVEVDSVFTIPVKELLSMKPDVYDAKITTVPGDDFPWELLPGGRDYNFYYASKKMYFYNTSYGPIWGITAEFLYMFLEDIRGGNG